MAITRPGFESAHDSERLLEGFEDLMPFRVNDILLVSSLYDSFILREDGRLNELLIGESLELNLHQVPGITHVSTGREAVELVLVQVQRTHLEECQQAEVDFHPHVHHLKKNP